MPQHLPAVPAPPSPRGCASAQRQASPLRAARGLLAPRGRSPRATSWGGDPKPGTVRTSLAIGLFHRAESTPTRDSGRGYEARLDVAVSDAATEGAVIGVR